MREQRQSIWDQTKDQQEKQLYEYLLMIFITVNQNTPFIQHQQCPQLNYLSKFIHKQGNLFNLFVRNPKKDAFIIKNVKDGLIMEKEKGDEQMDQRWGLLQKIIKRYPVLFSQLLNSSVSWEQIVSNIIIRQSLHKILNHFDKLLQNNQLSPDQGSVYSKNIDQQINLLVGCIVFSSRTNPIENQYEVFVGLIKKQLSTNLINASRQFSMNNLDHNNQLLNYIYGLISYRIEKLLSKYSLKHQKSHLFHQQYNDFLNIYKAQDVCINPRIFNLHHINQLLTNSQITSQSSVSISKLKPSQQQPHQNHKLNTINFLYLDFVQNQQKVTINQNLLNSFLKAPYQTSSFVLFTLLSHSQLKDATKFFNKSESQGNIDPIMFLLVKKELINELNIESVSLSMWIMTQVWLKFIQGKVCQRMKVSRENLIQSQKMTKLKDPRKIFTINQQSYGLTQSSSNVVNEKPAMSTMEEFQNNYKRPLMHTLVMYLLTLDMPSTMLKYYCIENDLIKEMAQSDILFTLFNKNSYIFTEQNQPYLFKNTSKLLPQHQYLNLINSISNIDTLQELQMFEKQYKQINLNKVSIPQDKQDVNFFQQQSEQIIPWIQIVESKQFIFPLLSKPATYQVLLKIIRKNPKKCLKLYDNILLKMILSEVQKKHHEDKIKNKENSGQKQGYQFKGNKNVKLKKSISYFSQKQKEGKGRIQIESRSEEKERKYMAIKEILQIYQMNSNDQNVKMTCSKLIKCL